ncbi:oxidoreductase [Xanthomonas campestris]|uniref:oxidoreductase n=1 Tax=Xanthomonas campestris TaxID=339 RepID=UPI001E58498A|nr:oxidoreductase [Xanthomonas campestris]MCC5069929.1 oxidoreductase [Xanthomonas campestris]MCC5086223.1 oxidoreductase [Xanthomonas campestris]
MNSKIALVTGASSGIGEATAARLANAGYTVYGTSRRGGTSTTAGVQMLALDVTDDASVAAAVDTILRKEGRLDLLVNNAGFSVAASAAEESSIQQAQSVFDTNFFGTLRMTNAVIGQMRKQGGGRILNIGSVLGLVPIPYAALYVASKHAIEGYTESLDHELRDWGIRVSVIEPAYTRTAFDTNALQPDTPMEIYQAVRTHVAAHIAQVMQKADAPSVVADVVLAAAQDAHPKARYTAGKVARQLSFLRRLLPNRMVGDAVRKDLKLHQVAAVPAAAHAAQAAGVRS